MNRTDVLLGRNKLSFSHQGFGNSEQIKVNVSLSDANLVNLVSEFDGSGFIFRDIEKLLPESVVELPNFVNNAEFIPNAIQELQLKFYQADKIKEESYDVLLGAGLPNKKQSINFINTTPNRFLTNQPTRKKTTLKSLEWLYFLNNYKELSTNLTLRVVATLEDNSTNTRNCFSIVNPKNGLYVIDVTPAYIKQRFKTELTGETSVGNKSIVSYTVQVGSFVETFLPISEVRSYYIVPDTINQIQLCFRNRFGVFDNIRLTGTQKLSQEVDYNNFETKSEVSTADTVSFDKLTMQLGDFEQNWLSYLKELTISKTIYIRQSGGYVRLICTTKSLPFFDSSKSIDETSIEFRYSDNENN